MKETSEIFCLPSSQVNMGVHLHWYTKFYSEYRILHEIYMKRTSEFFCLPSS